MKTVRTIAVLLMVIGSINWGLVGLFRLDVVSAILGSNIVTDIVFVLVGVSGVWGISLLTSGRSSSREMAQEM